MGELVGYVRVSTTDQRTDLQRAALEELGCVRIFEDQARGTRTDRPELTAALDYLRAGDVLVVWKLDRLGRSLKHLVAVVAELEERGVGFRSVTETIDTTSSTGKLIFHIFASLAQFERELIVDRTKAGLAAARARGSRPGRKPALSSDQVAIVRGMHEAGGHTVAAIANVVGVSRATVYRTIRTS
ncbi:recombinase family protein [Nocardioides sp. CN2-186]|uniref:recombinase family protein n=1 Tax=Nocardioides tweenelious TaxID=3156607 RepID=UPI0032B4759B